MVFYSPARVCLLINQNDFAEKMVELSKHLTLEKREYVLSKRLLRSGTSIGALVREAQHAESNADFVHKLSIALKEANETYYWLLLLHKTALAEQVHLRRAFKQVQADRFESP